MEAKSPTISQRLRSPSPGQQNANNSPRRPPSSMAPPGTASATDFSNVVPRNSSSKPATVASTSPHLEASNSDPDQVVEFTNTHDPENDSDTKRSYYDVSDSDDGPQPRRLIEDIYGVEQRRQQPMKKRKMEKGLKPAPITRPVVISGNTGIGEFIKEGDVQQSATTNLSDVVDLTDDTAAIPKDDDELQVTGFTDLSLQRVCYGKIENALINASKVPRPKAKSLFPDQWPPIKIDLHREPREGDSRIAVVDPHGEEFGTVDAKTAPVLCRLMDSPVIDLQIAARLDTRKIFPGEVPGVAISTAYRVSLTLYGERRRAEYIGKILSQHNVWLATPNFVEAGVPLFNPHAERRRAMAEAGVMMNSAGRDRQGSSIRYEARTAEEVTDSVTRMFNQLISADMEEMDPPAAIKTPLLSHQKQALWFMMKKEEPRTFKTENSEDSSLWRIEHQANGRKQYKEIISGIVSDSEPSQVFGGLLADEMGLGKTLSILSLTLKTLSQSKEWADQKTSHELIAQVPGIRNTRTTLLVVPLSAVSNWVAQIQEHLDPGSIKYYIFHGPSRTNKFLELAKYDLVITTYSTILSEISGRNAKRTGFSPLTKMCMFRIVLDEAHTIREQNAQQTQAILSLHAQRRWSVTGTPVQNRLEDLLSVTKFIKLYPYDEGQSFRQHIINPMKTGDPNVLKSLRVLIDSFTLRRVKDKINLPPREDKIIYLEFSEKEKQVHEFFRTESQVMMRVIAGETRTKLGGRMYHHVLKAMMILRQVSAHGKELLDVEDRERIKGLSMHDAIDLEENEDSTASATDKKAYGMFTLMQESSADQCACCSKRIEEPTPENGNGEPDRNLPMAYFLPCYDVLCPDCFTKWASNRDTQGSDGSIRCQVCEGWILPTWTTITPVGVDDFLAQQAHERQSRRQAKTFGEYEGPHTKTRALIQHLQDYAAESAKMVGQPPIKTVIFSAWTSHLDLIEIALRDHGFNGFKRLDGTMSLPQRSKSLEVFAKDDSITILLATIGAGGVGLNLTSASRVFVMEPQYNPAAVAQAVDRVHRLGQTRPVETVQFIMKESIEEKILDLAKKKQQLAEMSMNRKLAQKEMQAEKMEEYRALFK
ncbi:hypothetical protein N7492_006015 [Penicillium capsulatum]|uniref:SNF2 family helicase/ATPase n=1 Tax=Penicillium capsulatum TaxID=69766 RepID=A0A9W9IEF1_9EURO|nr:hypothetical protein N7492_006015 [Penicillium capsulatum]KAJ6134881.1 hypothetical protein N7512_000041 [Penicillium capsulatum]